MGYGLDGAEGFREDGICVGVVSEGEGSEMEREIDLEEAKGL